MKVASTASTPSTRPFDSFWEPHFGAFCRTVCKLGPPKGYQNGLQNDSVVRQYGTLGTLSRVTVGDPRGSRALSSGAKAVACGERTASERKGPLSQKRPRSADEGATGRGGTGSEQYRTNGFLTLWGKPGARGGARGRQGNRKYLARTAPSMLTARNFMR